MLNTVRITKELRVSARKWSNPEYYHGEWLSIENIGDTDR